MCWCWMGDGRCDEVGEEARLLLEFCPAAESKRDFIAQTSRDGAEFSLRDPAAKSRREENAGSLRSE